MKFFFAKTDSLYKIFKTLEKIPSQKAVQMFIDPEHPFFENQWWGKQMVEIIQKRKLNITFSAEKESNRKYFEQLGLNVHYEDEKPIIKFLKTLSLFFFDIKKFHLHAYNRQKYLFYMFFFFELIAWLWILWFIIILILPNATITIKVAQQTEDIIYNFRYYPVEQQDSMWSMKKISIPYYTWVIDYNYQLAISTENIQHIVNPSAGLVKIYNRTPRDIQLLANTRFVTSNGLVFSSKDSLLIPAWLEDNPSEITVKFYAAETDEEWLIMGVRGNIPKNTRMTIRNLEESYIFWEIWAESIEDFTGWSSTALWTITEKDQELLKERIEKSVYADKINIVSSQFKEEDSLVLTFDKLIKTTFHKPYTIDWKIWERATSLRWRADVTFNFLYLKWSDIVNAFTQYVTERQSDSIELISINPNSLIFIQELSWVNWSDSVFMIPTKVSIYQWYDFKRDLKWIIPAIRTNVAWKTLEEARKLILQYPEISSAKINLWIFQGSVLPNVKSRIKVKVEY